MTAGLALLLYSVGLALGAPPLLRRVAGSGAAPRFGVAAWLSVVGAVVLAWVIAAIVMVVDLAAQANRHSSLVASCWLLMHRVIAGQFGNLAQWMLGGTGVAAVGAVAIVGARLARLIVQMRAHAHRHAEAIRLVGHATAMRDVYVVEADAPAAYCVPGRPPAIVFTSAAVAALTSNQLSAVLAHERAHLIGRHGHIVAVLRGLARVLPRSTLFTDGVTEVARLLEMCADDAAARRHGRRALLSGLMALAGAAPAPALAAADIAVLTRAERLARPAVRRSRVTARMLLAATSAASVIVPIAMTVAVAIAVCA